MVPVLGLQIAYKRGRSHMCSQLLFKFDRNVVWFKILLKFENGLCGLGNDPVMAHNSQKCLSLPNENYL